MQYEKDFLVKIHQDLLETRMLEEKMIELYAEGRVPGHIHSGVGQEGSYVGILSTRKPGDYFKIAHRVVSASHIVGTPLDVFFGELLAKTSGNAGGRGGINHIGRLCDGMLGFSGSLGCDAAVAVGAALTISMEKRDNVAYAFFGDGATNRGPVYEAMNLAAAWKLPVLFVCENNQFGISTPTSYSSPVPNVMADKAAGFGMPFAVVDGTDVLAVYDVASNLVDGIRAGKGPAVIECKDYRWRGHFEGDQCVYRDASVAEKWIQEKDCVKNLEASLMEQGVMTQSQIHDARDAFAQKLTDAIAQAEAAPEMKPEEIFDYLYV